jgi:hypothetical protein
MDRAMRPQAHVAASLLIWSAGPGPLWEAPLCALAGNLPDLDRSVARRLGVRRRDHHRWVSHSFAGWAVPTAAALAGARGSRHAGTIRRGVACVWLHLLLDTYADGIAWLWPVTERKIGLFRKPPEIVDRGWQTPAPRTTNLGRLEALMWAGTAGAVARRAATA